MESPSAPKAATLPRDTARLCACLATALVFLGGAAAHLMHHLMDALILRLSTLSFLAFLVACVSAYLWRLLPLRRRLPPLADAGLLATVRALTTKQGPWFLLELARTGGRRVFRLRMPFLQHWVVVADAAAVRVVFDSSLDKPGAVYSPFDGTSCGVPTTFTMLTRDPRWAHARKGVAHAFSPARVKKALLRGQGKLERALQELEGRQGAPFDPAALMTELSLDMLGDSMLGGFDFGLVAAAPAAANPSAPSLGREFLDNLGLTLVEFALRQPNDPLRKPLLRLLPAALARAAFPLAADADAAAARNMQIAQLVLDDFRRRREAAPPEERAALGESILGYLVDNGAYASEAMRCADVQVYLIAGHDTTGFTLAWLLCELARCPERAARLRAELRRHEAAPEGRRAEMRPLATPGPQRCLRKSSPASATAFTGGGSGLRTASVSLAERAHVSDARGVPEDYWAVVSKTAPLARWLVTRRVCGVRAVRQEAAPFLSACVHETLRLWPVSSMGSLRESLAPIELPDGTQIPRGAICHMPFLLLHRLADIPAPDEWRPERWLDGEGKVRTPEGLLPLPFSLGQRNCVGQALAMAELRRTAAALAARFDFELVAPPTADFFLTLKPSGAMLSARPARSRATAE